jgi:hypothetical protein
LNTRRKKTQRCRNLGVGGTERRNTCCERTRLIEVACRQGKAAGSGILTLQQRTALYSSSTGNVDPLYGFLPHRKHITSPLQRSVCSCSGSRTEHSAWATRSVRYSQHCVIQPRFITLTVLTPTCPCFCSALPIPRANTITAHKSNCTPGVQRGTRSPPDYREIISAAVCR